MTSVIRWLNDVHGYTKDLHTKSVTVIQTKLENISPSCRLPCREKRIEQKVHTMKLDKIYTRTGDEGKTSLGDGSRLPKFHLRVTAYGSIDEVNSAIGVANLHVENPEAFQLFRHIQNDLFDVGADLCRPKRPVEEKPM